VKNSFLQNIKGKVGGVSATAEPQIKKSLPSFGEPKVTGFGQIARKKSDQIMSEPVVQKRQQEEEEK